MTASSHKAMTSVSLATGFALAIVASGGILAARLSLGDVRIALCAHVLLTLSLIVIMTMTAARERERGSGAARANEGERGTGSGSGAARANERERGTGSGSGAARANEREGERTSRTIIVQFIGAALGIIVAHHALRYVSSNAAPWMDERPAQFVNDAVAVFAPLMILWASSRRPPNTIVLASTLLLVTLYRMTGSYWHLDGGHFEYTVQNFVTGELAGSALGIAAFRLLLPS